MRSFTQIVDEHNQVLSASVESLEQPFQTAANLCIRALENKGKLLICGNGGSASDAQHFAAELVGRFERERNGWPAIALTTDTSIITALGNDYGFEHCFSRQVAALGAAGDILIAMSTSGNSENILRATGAARELDMKVIGFTGQGGGALAPLVDALFAVPAKRTARIQEVHEICLHALAEAIEENLMQQ
ncbi:MAG: SIS domain-containing protein [Desulfobacteraceae bacterium]|nr:SIS domain-containing protein [Desulfobacteraceae bacterium]